MGPNEFEAKATLNGLPAPSVNVRNDWHLASNAAVAVVNAVLGQNTEEHAVELTNPATGESRTYHVKSWFEFKQSARELRHKRQS